MIDYRPDEKKILDCILWLASRQPGMDMYRILKVLFLADKAHLNTYGRPIAGERYVAMPHGPVAETAYRILDRRSGIKRRLGLAEFPFTMDPDDDGREVRVFASHEPDLSRFSRSEINALADALERYGGMHFNALKALTHRHKSYERAWAQRGDKKSVRMNYADFLDGENDDSEVAEELEYASQFDRI